MNNQSFLLPSGNGLYNSFFHNNNLCLFIRFPLDFFFTLNQPYSTKTENEHCSSAMQYSQWNAMSTYYIN